MNHRSKKVARAGMSLIEVAIATSVLGVGVAALAKGRSLGGRRVAPERVFLPGRRTPVSLPEQSYGCRLIARVRDEAHRFAVSYHRNLRRKAAVRSPLTEVPGVGPRTAREVRRASPAGSCTGPRSPVA